jgi:hypothetical protein
MNKTLLDLRSIITRQEESNLVDVDRSEELTDVASEILILNDRHGAHSVGRAACSLR